MPDLFGIVGCVWLALVLATPLAAQESGLSVTISGDRLSLMRLATGASVDIDPQVIAEPGAGDPAIYLQAGNATLETLSATIAGTERPDALVRDGDHFVATLPIVVLPGATLHIGKGDQLELDRKSGSYLMSLGSIELDGARVWAGSGRHPHYEGFRPFIAGLGRDSVIINDTELVGLGYGRWLYSAGLFISGRGLLSMGQARPMRGNSFNDLRGVVLNRLDGIEMYDNTIETPRGTGLALQGIDHGIVDDLHVAGSRGSHALHVSAAQGLQLQRVRLEDGQGKGLRIDDDSTGVTFADVAISGFDGSGVTIGQGAGCLLFERTEIADNDGAGIAMRATGTVILSETYITRNDGPGLLIDSQLEEALVLLSESTLSANRMGLRGAGVTALRLHDNDLSDQRPRLLSGDLDAMTPDFLRATAHGGTGELAIRNLRLVEPEPLGPEAARDAFQACSKTERGT